jgi:predicted ATP-grasp superfamily ATP-dependent carboligase
MAGGNILIAAYSGRALAQAAKRAGYAAFVVDLFGDEDLRAAAARSLKAQGSLAEGFDKAGLMRALASLKQGVGSPVGFVYGAGFEREPELLGEVERLVPVRGNEPEVVQAVKNPLALAEACARLGIPHPDIRHVPPPPFLSSSLRGGKAAEAIQKPEHIPWIASLVARNDCGLERDGLAEAGWLLKHAGSAGGTGARLWRRGDAPPPTQDRYWQLFAPGEMWSALFAADGHEARIIGFSQQWTAPCAAAPFRFGGAVTAEPPAAFAKSLTDCARKLTHHFRLRGLNSIDVIADGEDWRLIEINPRPGATLDLFDSEARPLLTVHLEACAGTLPSRSPPQSRPSHALSIAYAERPFFVPMAYSWPVYAADIPASGSLIEVDSPICTAFAQASSPANARRAAQARARQIAARLASSPQPPAGRPLHAALQP